VSNQTICRVGEPKANLVLDAFLEHAKTSVVAAQALRVMAASHGSTPEKSFSAPPSATKRA
jgi:hypothetical protein